MHGVPHGGVLQFHQVLEDRVAENAAGVLGGAARQWRVGFAEVHGDQGGVAGLAALCSHLHAVRMLEELHHHAAAVARHLPLGPRGGVQGQDASIALHTLADAQRAQRVLA